MSIDRPTPNVWPPVWPSSMQLHPFLFIRSADRQAVFACKAHHFRQPSSPSPLNLHFETKTSHPAATATTMTTPANHTPKLAPGRPRLMVLVSQQSWESSITINWLLRAFTLLWSQDGRAVQGAAFRSQSSSEGVGSNPTLDR